MEKLANGQFYGTILKQCSVAHLTMTETHYLPNVLIPEHAHSSIFLAMPLEGAFLDNVEGKKSWTHSFELNFLPEGASHGHQFCDSPWSRCFNIELDAAWHTRIESFWNRMSAPLKITDWSTRQIATKLYGEFRLMDELSPMAIEGVMLEMISQIGRASKTDRNVDQPSWLQKAHELICDSYRESLTLDAISDEVGVHPVHLSREFRKHFQVTIGEFVRQRKIEYACRRLVENNSSIGRIAIQAGFSDQSHFTRTFKRLVGQTPNEFKKMTTR